MGRRNSVSSYSSHHQRRLPVNTAGLESQTKVSHQVCTRRLCTDAGSKSSWQAPGSARYGGVYHWPRDENCVRISIRKANPTETMENIAEIEKKYVSKTRAHIIKTFLQWGYILETVSQVDNILSGKAFCLPAPLVTWHCDLRSWGWWSCSSLPLSIIARESVCHVSEFRKTLNTHNFQDGFSWMCTAFLSYYCKVENSNQTCKLNTLKWEPLVFKML